MTVIEEIFSLKKIYRVVWWLLLGFNKSVFSTNYCFFMSSVNWLPNKESLDVIVNLSRQHPNIQFKNKVFSGKKKPHLADQSVSSHHLCLYFTRINRHFLQEENNIFV